MKKTALTFVAVAFGTCVAFAQTTPQKEEQKDNTEQSLTIDKLSDKPEEAGRRQMKVEELPAAIQTSLKSDEFKNFKVLSITEVQPQADAEPAVIQYEVAMLENTSEAVDVPSLVVLFDEKGKMLARTQPADKKNEEK